SPAIDEVLYRRLYLDSPARGSRLAAFSAAWRRRRADLDRINDFDVVFLQKGVFPGLYSGFEKKLAARKPLVFDFDDAIWLPRVGGSRVLQALHREKTVQDVMQRAAAVIAGNACLAEYASRFNKAVTVVPSSICLENYPQASGSSLVGWIGSRTTLAYLKPLKPAFESLGIRPRVIASGNPVRLGFDVEFRPWQLETELNELSQFGIGISPLLDTPWERGKCGVKILQYMACGVPVIASPVGVNPQIITHGVNGLLATHLEDWEPSLLSLISDAKLRQRLGAAGRTTIEKRFRAERAAEAVYSVLRALA
ncbi:MAG TPA: glycosyltransferase family 4 protein, partial [Verrucomicrobiae bacterium]|nr:glycosyltransferase family 4 protein [Verrucomicrobiae bacterium]